MSNFAYLGQPMNPTGFTNNWLAERNSIHLFSQNYRDFPLYEEYRRGDGSNAYDTLYDNSYRDILKTQVERTPLSDAYFGMDNIRHLKKVICDTIYKQSGGLYKITPEAQSSNELLTVMRSIFLNNAKNFPERIKEQVAELNYLVVLDLVPRVISNIQQGLSYMRDQSQQHLTMDRPMWVSSTGTRTNRSVTTTFI
jgi:hypothetical protein